MNHRSRTVHLLLRFRLPRGLQAGGVVTLAAALVLAALLGGCGSNSGTASTSPSSNPSPAASTVAGVTITPDASLRAMLPDEVQKANAITVPSDIPYAPFEMYVSPGSKELTGFDYDLGQALGAKIGIPVVFTDLPFDAIIPALQAGRGDITMSSMYDNKERQKVLDFVDYARVGSGLLVLKGNPSNITTLESLSGQPVATESGTVQAAQLNDLNMKLKAQGKPAVKVLEFKKEGDSLLALQSGKVVAEFTVMSSCTYVARTLGDGQILEVVNDPAAPNGYVPAPLGIGMLTGRTGLRDALQKALQALIDDGTYAKILEKYDFQSIGVTSALVNQGH